MAIVLTGTKTSSVDVSPVHTAAKLTTLWAKAPELWTYGDLQFLLHCTQAKAGAEENNVVLGALFS